MEEEELDGEDGDESREEVSVLEDQGEDHWPTLCARLGKVVCQGPRRFSTRQLSQEEWQGG